MVSTKLAAAFYAENVKNVNLHIYFLDAAYLQYVQIKHDVFFL